jgi:hypothetical protein
MFNDLTAIGYGLVVFAIVIGVSSVVLSGFGTAVSSCSTVGGGTATYNVTSQLCTNTSGSTANPSTATINSNYLLGQFGSGGLAGWTPAIVAISIGLLFLGAFMIKGAGKGRY